MAGEVLEGGGYVVGVVGLDEGARLGDDHGGVGGKAAAQGADDGIGRVAVDVDDGGEVVVDARRRQRLGHGFGLRVGKGRIAAFAQRLRRHGGREAVLFVQARNQPAFLVGGDQQGRRGTAGGCGALREGLQSGRQPGELRGRLDVARRALQGHVVAKQHDGANSALRDVCYNGRSGRQGRAAEADHDHLRQHLLQ